MREVRIQKKSYQVPDQWEDCTVGDLIEVMRIQTGSMNPTAKAMQIMQALTNIPNRVLQACDLEEVNLLCGCLGFIASLPPVDIQATNGGKITLDGVTYTAPDEIGRMEFQQFVDFEVKIDDTRQSQWEMIPYALAIYMSDDHARPYDSNEMLKTAEKFKRLPVIQANNLAGFFLLNAELSKRIFQACTIKMAQMRIMQAQAISGRTQAPTTVIGSLQTRGTRRSTTWLKRTLIRCLLWNASRQHGYLLSYTKAERKQRLWRWTKRPMARFKAMLDYMRMKIGLVAPQPVTIPTSQ